MNPEFIDGMSWEMAEVYGAITDQILINLSRYFKYYKPGETVPKSSFEYQANMLAQMGQVNKETVRIISGGLKDADGALQNAMTQAIIDAVSKAQPELLDAVKKGILQPAGIPVVAPEQMRAFQLYYKQAADKLNLVNTVMLESTKSAYQQTVSDVVAEIELAERINATYSALDIAAGETVTGVSSWNQALQHATKRMADRGITGFIDHAGHRWSAEAYAAMDIRTTMANTARAAVWETNQNFGNDLYSVSYHNGARPLCYPYQNKVVSSTDNARTVADLDGNEIEVIAQSATSYGQPAGLFGINCKHYPTPFIPGVSIIRGEPQDPEENQKTYEESQQQRGLERKIREQKRDLLMMKEQGASPDAIKAQREKIRETSTEIDDFCDSTGRARRKNREGVYTKREFPDADKYDVTKFEHQQRDIINDYFGGGGAQSGYTFGEMKPTTPIAPQQVPFTEITPNPDVATFNPAKTIAEAEAYAQDHFGNKYSEMSYKGIAIDYANTANRVLTEVNEKYDVPTLKGVQPMNMRTKMFRGTTSEAAYHWGGDGTLYINPTYYKSTKTLTAHKAEIDRLQKICMDGGENFLKSGKYTGAKKEWLETLLRTGRQCVAQSHDFVEGTFVHESGHMLEHKVFAKAYDDFFGTKGQFEGARKYLLASQSKYAGNISAYSVMSVREYVAESFAAWWYGETSILDPKLVEVFEGTMRK